MEYPKARDGGRRGICYWKVIRRRGYKTPSVRLAEAVAGALGLPATTSRNTVRASSSSVSDMTNARRGIRSPEPEIDE